MDAIRCCIEAIGLSYARLVSGAVAAEDAMRGGVSPLPLTLFVDAWALVDWVHRLHDLVEHAPGLKKSPGKELFLRETASSNRLRNAFQHPTGEYAKGTPDGTPWGSLAWVYVVDATHVRSWVAVIGGLNTAGTHPVVNPIGHLRGPADRFELSAFGESGSLSRWFDAVVAFADELEQRVATASAALGAQASTCVTDLLVCIDMEFDPSPLETV